MQRGSLLLLNKLKYFPSITRVRLTGRFNAGMMRVGEERLGEVLRPGVKTLAEMFQKHGHEVRVAGGAVRDLLLGHTPHDLDFATTATPDQMKTMFSAEGVRMINLGGEKHGTVTARIGEENFECTTLRVDLVTDGRHAEVRFTTDWEEDAHRRDLTINAMFLGLDGTIYDYFSGQKHLQEKLVTFVGDADRRIKEDYLRILRYFRFYGRIAETPDNHCPHVLESIRANVDGLGRISGERIWVELQKILTGNFGGDLMVKMVECGVGPHLGLSPNFDCGSVLAVYRRCGEAGLSNKDLHHMTLLASGIVNDEDCAKLIARVKCSKREQELLLFVVQHRDVAMQAASVKVIKDLMADFIIGERRNKEIILFYVTELLKYTCRLDFLEEIKVWEMPRFPINGNMVADKGVPRKKIKFAMNDLLQEWKESNFTLSDESLLNMLDVKNYQ